MLPPGCAYPRTCHAPRCGVCVCAALSVIMIAKESIDCPIRPTGFPPRAVTLGPRVGPSTSTIVYFAMGPLLGESHTMSTHNSPTAAIIASPTASSYLLVFHVPRLWHQFAVFRLPEQKGVQSRISPDFICRWRCSQHSGFVTVRLLSSDFARHA